MIYECLRARRVCVESPNTKKYKLANWIKNNIIQSEKAIVNEKLNMRQDTACPALTSKKVEPNSSPVLPQQGPSKRPLSSPESDSIFDTFVYPSSSSSETVAAVDEQPKPKTPTLKEQEVTKTSEVEDTVEVVDGCILMKLSDLVDEYDEYNSAYPMDHEMSSHSLSMLIKAGTASHITHDECTNTCEVSSWSEAPPNLCNPDTPGMSYMQVKNAWSSHLTFFKCIDVQVKETFLFKLASVDAFQQPSAQPTAMEANQHDHLLPVRVAMQLAESTKSWVRKTFNGRYGSNVNNNPKPIGLAICIESEPASNTSAEGKKTNIRVENKILMNSFRNVYSK